MTTWTQTDRNGYQLTMTYHPSTQEIQYSLRTAPTRNFTGRINDKSGCFLKNKKILNNVEELFKRLEKNFNELVLTFDGEIIL